MSKEKRYLQWGYDSFKDTKTGEISDNHIHLLNKQAEQISDLEAKLAEKDEFLKKQKELFETVDRELYLTKDTLKHHTNIYNSLVESKDQDKISFCIEQLEKVKEFVDNLDTPCVESVCNEYMCDIEDYIDNQINVLRNNKDGIH